MARSSGERTRDVKRRSARRGGSIPSRAEQQEKSIFCNKHPRLKRYRPPERRTQGRQIHTGIPERREKDQPARKARVKQIILFLTARKDEQNHFFWQPERRQIKYVSQTACRRAKTAALMADIAGIARVLNVNPSSFNASDSCCFPFVAVDAKHLARAPGSIPGSAPSLQRSPKRKEGKNEA